jgi:hypothetical protein
LSLDGANVARLARDLSRELRDLEPSFGQFFVASTMRVV